MTFLTTVGQAAPPPLGCWTFDSDHIKGTTILDQAGKCNGSIQGTVHQTKDPLPALDFDGNANIVDFPAVDTRDLPSRQFSIEAWVSLEAGKGWGGIVSCFQNTGALEKGWLLGHDESHFRFAVSASGRLAMVTGSSTFQKGQWYHVVGTYNGENMKLYVNGKLENTSEQRGDIDYPAQASLMIGAYRDEDKFVRSQGKIHEVTVHRRVLEPGEIDSLFTVKKGIQKSQPVVYRVPPYSRFVAPDAAVISWESEEPGESVIEYGVGESWDQQVQDTGLKTEHQITLHGLKSKERYQCRIRTSHSPQGSFVSEAFELDNGLNYTVSPASDSISPYGSDERDRRYVQAAEQILAASKVTRGYCLVIDCNQGQLAYELARRSELIVFGVDSNRDQIAGGRALLSKAGVYGTRITLRQADSLESLPFPRSFANLIVVDGSLAEDRFPGAAAQVMPLLQPATGVAILGPLRFTTQSEAKNRMGQWLGEMKIQGDLVQSETATWVRLKRELPPNTGSWTHQYGDAGNSANSQEGLQGAAGTDRLEVQWLGRPGADFGIDRNPRMPAPLAVNGRLFHQGLNRLIALDSYNGAVLWSLEIPALRRVNMPRDAGNWCADPERLYVAVKDRCWVIAARTGALIRTLPLADPGLRSSHEWGYVARTGELLYGSSVKHGGMYTDFWGTESWYDATSGQGTEKICSDDLFAMASQSDEVKWRYCGGVIVNSTIAIAGGKVLFVESRHPEVKALTTSRVGSSKLWQDQHLVALDARTGDKLWDQPIDTAAGIVVFYLLASEDRVFIMSSAAGKYHLYAFSATDGKSLWQSAHDWPKDNHGGHLQHPVVVRNTIFLEPCGYEAATGKLLTKDVGRHGGCATYAATLNALIYRGDSGRISMWDIEREAVTSWYNLRPSCWLSTVPANGMVLSPEGGGGCSCGNWLETSIGFAPVFSSMAK